MEDRDRVGDVRTEALESGVGLLDHRIGGESWQFVFLQNFVHFGNAAGDLCLGERAVEQIRHPQAATVDFIGIGRADATLCGPDFLITKGNFTGGIQFFVKREDDVGAVRDEEFVRSDFHALALDALDLNAEADGIDDNAVADDVNLVVPEDAGRE